MPQSPTLPIANYLLLHYSHNCPTEAEQQEFGLFVELCVINGLQGGILLYFAE